MLFLLQFLKEWWLADEEEEEEKIIESGTGSYRLWTLGYNCWLSCACYIIGQFVLEDFENKLIYPVNIKNSLINYAF